jgi:methionyl-tRNA formyltransferase
MNIAILCNTDSLVLPTLNMLRTQGLLNGVAVWEKNAAVLLPAIQGAGVNRDDIYAIDSTNWKSSLKSWLQSVSPDMVWVFGFPKRIPSDLLSIPSQGFYNFHFGALPKYKGADPVFWQIRNGEAKSELTIHRMTTEVDAGPVVLTHETPMMAGESYGMLCGRMGYITVAAVEKLLQLYRSNALKELPQHTSSSEFYHKPSEVELCINWNKQTSSQVENLVNACNPKYGGASAWIRNMEMRILEVAHATVSDVPQTAPGTIVYADAVYGLIVACKDNTFVRINIVHMPEGYLSGSKLFGIGIHQGEQFTLKHIPSLETINN